MPDEVLICKNKELAAMDREMASFYSWAMNNFKGGFRTHLQRTQVDWLKRRRACGYDVECIGQAYDDRLADFGDGDMMLYEFCRNHVNDVDCRKEPGGAGPAFAKTGSTIKLMPGETFGVWCLDKEASDLKKKEDDYGKFFRPADGLTCPGDEGNSISINSNGTPSRFW